MKYYYTFIDKNHRLGEKEYVMGRIAGYQAIICGNEETGFITADGSTVLVCKTIAPLYWAFKKLIEKRYPGLCRFNCYLKEEQES